MNLFKNLAEIMDKWTKKDFALLWSAVKSLVTILFLNDCYCHYAMKIIKKEGSL